MDPPHVVIWRFNQERDRLRLQSEIWRAMQEPLPSEYIFPDTFFTGAVTDEEDPTREYEVAMRDARQRRIEAEQAWEEAHKVLLTLQQDENHELPNVHKARMDFQAAKVEELTQRYGKYRIDYMNCELVYAHEVGKECQRLRQRLKEKDTSIKDKDTIILMTQRKIEDNGMIFAAKENDWKRLDLERCRVMAKVMAVTAPRAFLEHAVVKIHRMQYDLTIVIAPKESATVLYKKFVNDRLIHRVSNPTTSKTTQALSDHAIEWLVALEGQASLQFQINVVAELEQLWSSLSSDVHTNLYKSAGLYVGDETLPKRAAIGLALLQVQRLHGLEEDFKYPDEAGLVKHVLCRGMVMDPDVT